MAAGVSLVYNGSVTVTETLATILATAPVLVYDFLNKSSSYNGATTPAVTKAAVNSKAMSAGAATIDLTLLASTNNVNVDMTGLKVQAYKFQNPGANAITVKNGASTGYLLGGVAWSLTIPPGGEFQGYLNNVSQSVGGTTKNIDISGTGTDTLNYILVFG